MTACEIIELIIRTNAELESLILEYDLAEAVQPSGSIAKTLLNLKRFAVQNPNHLVMTDRGERPIAAVLIDKAIQIARGDRRAESLLDKLERHLNLDGYAFAYEVVDGLLEPRHELVGFTISMPEFVALPESSSEVERLLDENSFEVARRHLNSARENITQGDWEASNSQCRTFLEALTDAIADNLFANESTGRRSGLEKRQLLAEKGFLSRDKHEFGDGNGQTFLPGLAKLLHPDGAHPGISNQHDALFRLQVVVVTARWLLKRHEVALSNRTLRTHPESMS
ncbi:MULTISPECIES: hypothetical protein [unclassified Mesorhizobium]|uniref:hypothetical protein n=1 Tax=unclassified Mesorhizobium TaxID=325217 RepID=UPI000FCCDCB5|nr:MULTISPECIES: hypothetical protein [unclassified Mesorhizobium]RUZ80163.1 hypothetical protein EN947_20385 [Mesorhizobium sp. M7A.F.Ca.US.003.02.2.1]RUY96050.1 hypothetical protein EN974_20250 [Mesorhizobium sp. M7A.F.Ca.CA.001.12.2.1]RUZ25233.1 hypothetical protein EN949_14445 [Mesorhizobium sp. M7A.F.Ca.US.007.01.2.1]RUZ49873.1 hypothetical protein EN948_02980 [Mesorhizobium sp. M7A.F.Ca.US.003.02.1.1]RUZ70320.1 hypothetical protein EN950_01090 [Mesorhizobium sp. M7A.F.Ca.US.007.01.1.1]